MSLNDEVQAPQRRRGAALENALLDAAWDELVDRGYTEFTIESVAERARTSRAVLYRRWPTKPELARAAVLHAGRKEQVEIPDTGSLRDDVVELLRRANGLRARLGIMMTLQLSGYYAETGTGPSELRNAFLAGRGTAVEHAHFPRARARRGRPRQAQPAGGRRAVRPLPARAADDPQAGARRGHRVDRRRGVHAPRAAVGLTALPSVLHPVDGSGVPP